MKQKRSGMHPVAVAFLVILTVLTMLIVSGIFTFLSMDLSFCTVHGDSMMPTIKNGAVLLLNPEKEVERFDIAVFDDGSEYVIKRIIGLPGDEVTVLDGHLFVNDELYNEPYVDMDYSTEFANESFKVVVPEDSYFVLGDNRDGSFDSREAGVVPDYAITGVAIWTVKEG